MAHAAAARARRLRDRHRRAPLGARVRRDRVRARRARSGRTSCASIPRCMRPAEVDTLLADPTKAREQLGWSARTTLRASWCGIMVEADLEAQERASGRAARRGRARDEPRRARARHRRRRLHRLDARRAPARRGPRGGRARLASTPSIRSRTKRRNLRAALGIARASGSCEGDIRDPPALGARLRARRAATASCTWRRWRACARASSGPREYADVNVRGTAAVLEAGVRARAAARGVRVVVVGLRRARRRRAVPRDRRRSSGRSRPTRRPSARASCSRTPSTTRSGLARRLRAHLHRLRPAPAPGPRDAQVRRAHAARRADPGVRRRQEPARLHLRRRPGRRAGARARPRPRLRDPELRRRPHGHGARGGRGCSSRRSACGAQIEWQPRQTGDVSRTWADIGAARAALGYAPRVPLRGGHRALRRLAGGQA